jgi:predicted nucleic-acid-binding Zn-ribbon protein
MATKKTETGKKRGRPKAEIPQKEFEKLCQIQATREEISDFFDVDEKTLNEWCKRTYGENFSLVYKKKSSGGKMSLRRTQFQLAKKSAAMAIFLGKNYLGQTDRPINEVENENDNFIEALKGSADVWEE